MFDFLRNLTKSAEEKRQETVAAYLDGALRGRSRQQFEQAMAQDEALRQEVEQLRLIKQSLRQLPQREVPRNFILDPAAFTRRPDPQPWVQAYPVLRTATALAAFFFIFALAAGIFTGFGGAEAPGLAPAADVAQVEEIAVTRVETETVTEEFETSGGEAETIEEDTAETTEDAEVELFEEAEEEMADEESAEVTPEEAEVVESMAEEPVIDEAASPAEPLPTTTPQADAAADEATPELQATAAAEATFTPTPPPTPTVSTLPRVTPPTPLPDRDPEIAEGADTANDAADGDIPAPVVDGETESAETTAVLPEEAVREDDITRPVSPLLWLQIGLGALLLLLVGLTFYARRQR